MAQLSVGTTQGEIGRSSEGVGTDTLGEFERLKEKHKMHVPNNQETPLC